MQFGTEDGIVTWIKSAVDPDNPTQAEIDAVEAHIAQEQIDYQAKQAAREAARPKRSQINAAKTSVANASSVAALRDSVVDLMTLLDNVLAYQNVNIDEDE